MKAYAAFAVVAALGLAGGLVAVNKGHASWDDTVLKAEDIGGNWPFSVKEIKVECGDQLAIYGHVGDKVFPLNGQAERLAMDYKHGPVTRLEDIQKDDLWTGSFVPGAKMSMDPVQGPLIKLCEKQGRWLKT